MDEEEGRGKRVEDGTRQQESICRNVRLNERNVNHKKLRAFKSPTRWCTFALITLHLSFLPWPPSSGVVPSPLASVPSRECYSESGRVPSFCSPPPPPTPRNPPFLTLSFVSHLHSAKTSISFSHGPLLVSFARYAISRSLFLAPRNFLPRIDHLQGRTLLGIISYVVVEHSRPDMRCVP